MGGEFCSHKIIDLSPTDPARHRAPLAQSRAPAPSLDVATEPLPARVGVRRSNFSAVRTGHRTRWRVERGTVTER
jgi:hypothetical protein